MGVHIGVTYQGDLRCLSIHGPSKDKLPTDAPADNQGKGEHFSPTDLLATALGTCMLTTMGIVAKRHNIPFEKATASVEKEMGSQPRRHVSKVSVTIMMPVNVAEEHRSILEHAAKTCPVTESLSPNTEVVLSFSYPC